LRLNSVSPEVTPLSKTFAEVQLTLYKALITSIMTYACHAWEFAENSYSFKLRRLQNKVPRTTGNLSRRTSTCYLHMAFKIPYLQDFVTKLSRQQATDILNHENVDIRNTGQGEAQRRKYKRPKLGGGQPYGRSTL
jgi:hypothetical protein